MSDDERQLRAGLLDNQDEQDDYDGPQDEAQAHEREGISNITLLSFGSENTSEQYFDDEYDEDEESYLELMPQEIINRICLYLSARDVAALGATCRQLRQQAADDYVWQTMYLRLPENTVTQDQTLAQRMMRLGSSRGLWDVEHEVLRDYKEVKKPSNRSWRQHYVEHLAELREEYDELIKLDEIDRYHGTWEYRFKICCDSFWTTRSLAQTAIVLSFLFIMFAPLAYVIMVNLKLDQIAYVNWSWTQLMLPLWLMAAVTLVGFCITGIDEGANFAFFCCVPIATALLYGIILLFPLLVSLKVDQTLTSSWFAIFIPVYLIIGPSVVIGLCFIGIMLADKWQRQPNQPPALVPDDQVYPILVTFISDMLCPAVFSILLPMWLENQLPGWKLHDVMLPLWIGQGIRMLFLLSMVAVEACVTFVFQVLPSVLSTVFLVLKVEHAWDISYGIVFLPTYVIYGGTNLALTCFACYFMGSELLRSEAEDRAQAMERIREVLAPRAGVVLQAGNEDFV